VKHWAKFVALLLTAVLANAQSTLEKPESQRSGQEIQRRDYWVDPSTGLMWAAKDNARDVNWRKATKYCRDLRLAGYSDWRLANIGELEAIYDKDASALGLAGMHDDVSTRWHVKGNLFLTGYQWSSTRMVDTRGHFSGYAAQFDFNQGRMFNGDELGFDTFKRALCVRGSWNGRRLSSPG
jgi:hypothetical protein